MADGPASGRQGWPRLVAASVGVLLVVAIAVGAWWAATRETQVARFAVKGVASGITLDLRGGGAEIVGGGDRPDVEVRRTDRFAFGHQAVTQRATAGGVVQRRHALPAHRARLLPGGLPHRRARQPARHGAHDGRRRPLRRLPRLGARHHRRRRHRRHRVLRLLAAGQQRTPATSAPPRSARPSGCCCARAAATSARSFPAGATASTPTATRAPAGVRGSPPRRTRPSRSRR